MQEEWKTAMGLIALAVLAVALIGMADAANYMYEKATVKGMGSKNAEMIISTQTGFDGSKLVEKVSGSGNVITDRSELEAERQIGSRCGGSFNPQIVVWKGTDEPGWPEESVGTGDYGPWGEPIYGDFRGFPPYDDYHFKFRYQHWPTGIGPMDYINFTRENEYEYMPISYQTGTYDQKWIDKLCVQNYAIGAVLTEMYTRAEHLQKTTEVKTRGYKNDHTSYSILVGDDFGTLLEFNAHYPPTPCCNGVLEANLNSNIIGVAHIGWMSRDQLADIQLKGRHAEYGRSVEDLTGVFAIQKFIQLWGNSTCGAISVDWLPCA